MRGDIAAVVHRPIRLLGKHLRMRILLTQILQLWQAEGEDN